MKRMRRLRILNRILKQTGADRLLYGFVVFYILCAAVIWLCEPGIQTMGDALWYCYAVITTVGFGDILVTTPLPRFISVILSIYAILVIAIVTGVVVNFFNQIVELRQSETMMSMLDKLEHLPEMSGSELEEISQQVREMRNKR